MPNGVDTQVFSRAAIDPNSKASLGLAGFTVLGFTGYVRDWNGLDVAIDLLARPDGQQLFLLVVGDGPARAALEAQAARLGVSARLRFTSVVARDRVASLVSSFDIALQPAANPYASPLKLFEYMALARAIVAPDQPNIREILEDGRDAILFQPGVANSFAAAVMRLVGDPALRSHVANGAAETVRRRDFTWRRNAERVRELAHRLSADPVRQVSAGRNNTRQSL
jgi:glycosyltransferase involved in cell wall biosynthesis